MHGDEVVVRAPLIDRDRRACEHARVRLADPTRTLAAYVRRSLFTTRPQHVDAGDVDVFLRATVIHKWHRRELPGMVARIELSSDTDLYHIDLLADQVVAVVIPQPPAEPGDGTWLTGWGDWPQTLRAFHRCDHRAEPDPYKRRFPRRWFDVADTAWIGWDKVLRRGADPARQLQELRIPHINRRPHVHNQP